MKPYGQKRNWVELEDARKYSRGTPMSKREAKKKKPKHWKKEKGEKQMKNNLKPEDIRKGSVLIGPDGVPLEVLYSWFCRKTGRWIVSVKNEEEDNYALAECRSVPLRWAMLPAVGFKKIESRLEVVGYNDGVTTEVVRTNSCPSFWTHRFNNETGEMVGDEVDINNIESSLHLLQNAFRVRYRTDLPVDLAKLKEVIK